MVMEIPLKIIKTIIIHIGADIALSPSPRYYSVDMRNHLEEGERNWFSHTVSTVIYEGSVSVYSWQVVARDPALLPLSRAFSSATVILLGSLAREP